jgi:hypothetical protein
MPPIDYTIPGQIRGVQIESPMNAMMEFAQLQGLQQQQQLNALKARESSEMNALLRQQREATTEKSKYDLDQAQKKEERDAVDFQLKQFNDQFPAYSIGSEEDVEARITAMANDQILGPLSTRFGPLEDTIARNKAEFRRDPRNYVARLSGVSADKILEAADARENAAFSQDQLNRAINKQPLISIEEWRAGQRQPQAALAPAAATPTSTDAAMPTEAAVTTADGVKQFPNASFKGDVGGVDFLDPTAQALYTLASDPRNKDRAPALRDMADKMQAEHVKRLEEDRKRNQLTGDFLNVTVAEDKIAELEKNPTPVNLKKIKNLREQIKAANQGKAPKISNILKMPPGPKAVDEKYAGDYLAWRQGGGSDAAGNAAQIKSVLDRLASGEALTGKSIGLAPDFFNALVNPAALGAKQQVEEVVQRNLRAVLGAQFTQVEGERLIARAFDARLSPQENIKRLRKLFMQMEIAAQQKEAMAQYYEANETLRGYKGKQPSIQDFYNVLNAPDAPPKGSVDVKGPDGKTYRFPDKKSADEFKKSAGIKE